MVPLRMIQIMSARIIPQGGCWSNCKEEGGAEIPQRMDDSGWGRREIPQRMDDSGWGRREIAQRMGDSE
jgi:hypothetical protein